MGYNIFAPKQEAQQTGSTPGFDEWYKTVPADRNDTSNYNLRRAYELAPKEELERWRTATPEQLQKDDSYHLKSMYFDPKTGVGEFMKSKNHPTLQGELDFYYGNSPQSKEFRDKYDLDKSGDYYRYVPRMQATTPQPQQPAVEQAQRKAQPTSAPVATDGGKTMGIRSGEWDNEPMKRGGYIGQPITSADELAKAMGYTSPQEEEKMRKASVANQRIMAVADALRHIGNIANTVGYAPSQQFNSPVEMERQRYQQAKALRDRANQTYISYQQAKEQQEAKQRQWEAEYGIKAANAADLAAYRKRQGDIAAGNAASQAAYREGNLARQKQRDADQKAHNEAALKQRAAYQNRMAGIAGMNAQTNKRRADAYINKLKSSGGGGASGIAPLDTPRGQITPNGRSYGNQLLQMFDYAKSRGLVQESDVSKRLRELGFGKDQSDNVKRQMVMDLLRTNSDLGDYASERLGWTYGNYNAADDLDLDLDGDEDEMDLGLE